MLFGPTSWSHPSVTTFSDRNGKIIKLFSPGLSVNNSRKHTKSYSKRFKTLKSKNANLRLNTGCAGSFLLITLSVFELTLKAFLVYKHTQTT